VPCNDAASPDRAPVQSFCSIGTILPSRPARATRRRAQRRSRMARFRATAPAARSVLDGREHDGSLDRVGAVICLSNKQTIKRRSQKAMKKRADAYKLKDSIFRGDSKRFHRVHLRCYVTPPRSQFGDLDNIHGATTPVEDSSRQNFNSILPGAHRRESGHSSAGGASRCFTLCLPSQYEGRPSQLGVRS
jgi:hypothetical protein